ncbi:Uncharacterized protein FWK35_00018601 [Aphis craccivora]|uniref:FLYWCH-type domain-containing protein n=1 Tax=Aphis craccivora TaxID=307492 RepID=A0A6G0Y4B1_APHCR|nr:Uncharacterized protein FWK35_00018601 [Aphis craccivora]
MVRSRTMIGMENTLEIIKSEKGNDLALVNTCKYRHIRQRKDGKVKWRCIHKTCTAITDKVLCIRDISILCTRRSVIFGLVGDAAVRGVNGGDTEGEIWAATSSHRASTAAVPRTPHPPLKINFFKLFLPFKKRISKNSFVVRLYIVIKIKTGGNSTYYVIITFNHTHLVNKIVCFENESILSFIPTKLNDGISLPFTNTFIKC